MRFILAVAATALVGAGCGAAENEPNLAAAIDQTQAAGSSRFEMSGTESSGNEMVDIECTGEADYDTRRLRLECDYSTESMELIATGRTTYVRGDVFGFGGAGDKWVKYTGDEILGNEFSPQVLLAMLRDASRSTERVGEEQVRGDETVRYRLAIDCEQAQVPDCDQMTAPVEVWVGDDGLVRRIVVEQGASPFTVEFYDFGADVAITAPDADDVVTLDEWTKTGP